MNTLASLKSHSNVSVTRAELAQNTQRDANGAVDQQASAVKSFEMVERVRPYAVAKDVQTLIWFAANGAYGEVVQENVLAAIASPEGLTHTVTIEALEDEAAQKDLATKLVGAKTEQQLHIVDSFATPIPSIGNAIALSGQQERENFVKKFADLDGRIMVINHNGKYFVIKVYANDADIKHTENEIEKAVIVAASKKIFTLQGVENPKTKVTKHKIEGTAAEYQNEEKLPLVMRPSYDVANANIASLMPLIKAAADCYVVSADGNSREFHAEKWPFDFEMNPALQTLKVIDWANEGLKKHSKEISEFFATNNFDELVGNYVGNVTCIYSVPNDEHFAGYATKTGIRFFTGVASLGNMVQTSDEAKATVTLVGFCKVNKQNENRRDIAMRSALKAAREIQELKEINKDKDNTMELLRKLQDSGIAAEISTNALINFITGEKVQKQSSQTDLED